MNNDKPQAKHEHFREALSTAILFRVSDELEDVVGALPSDISEEVREAIRNELVPYSRCVLTSWSLETMQNDTSVDVHIANIICSARYLVQRITERKGTS